MGTLFLVATPIGNLEDMTFRAVRVLREVDLIAAEDTRHSGRLLTHFDIESSLVSYHGHSGDGKIGHILQALGTGDVAMISDAGMPGISDPGAALVRAAINAGHEVIAIPGASAVTTAVAVSGLVDAGFLFAGYPPRRSRDRQLAFTRLRTCGYPVVLFESPYRVVETLEDIAAVYGEVPMAACRELTKQFEEVARGTPSELLAECRSRKLQGEFVLVIATAEDGEAEQDTSDTDQLARALVEQGLSASKAARELATVTGMPRTAAYELILKVKNERG